jgi:hypothetical protein
MSHDHLVHFLSFFYCFAVGICIANFHRLMDLVISCDVRLWDSDIHNIHDSLRAESHWFSHREKCSGSLIPHHQNHHLSVLVFWGQVTLIAKNWNLTEPDWKKLNFGSGQGENWELQKTSFSARYWSDRLVLLQNNMYLWLGCNELLNSLYNIIHIWSLLTVLDYFFIWNTY